MLFEKIAVLAQDEQVQPELYVAVQGDSIAYVGRERPKGDFGRRYDGRGKLLMPGLVNAHSHAPMTLLRGYAEGLALQAWLNERVFPFEARLTGQDVYFGSLLAYAEMLRFGVTASADMYFFGQDMAKAVLDSGMRANICLSVTCFDDRAFEELPVYEETLRLLESSQGAGNGRLRVDACLHAEYSSTPKVVAGVADFARRMGLRVHVHLSETRQEHEACKARWGLTPAAYLERQGLLENPGIAAHCVHCEEGDRQILAKHGVSAACNPVSNLKLASGILDAPAMLRAGVNLCLGTDGAASNNNLNLFEEMKDLALLSKGLLGDPCAVSAQQALRAATRGGALALGREDCGLIKAGLKADLVVLDAEKPWWSPRFGGPAQLCFGAQGSDVVLTMVDGRVLYEDGRWLTIDVEEARDQVQRRAERIAAELGA